MWVILLKASTPLSPRCTTCSIHPQAAVAMSTLAVSSGVQRGFFTEEGRGAARLLSGNQCSTSEVGWLLGIPQWDYCGQENMESQRKRHYDIMQSVQMHVCSLCVCLCICGWVHLSSSFCMWVTVCLCVCVRFLTCVCAFLQCCRVRVSIAVACVFMCLATVDVLCMIRRLFAKLPWLWFDLIAVSAWVTQIRPRLDSCLWALIYRLNLVTESWFQCDMLLISYDILLPPRIQF